MVDIIWDKIIFKFVNKYRISHYRNVKQEDVKGQIDL